jgi:hypothetical protein
MVGVETGGAVVLQQDVGVTRKFAADKVETVGCGMVAVYVHKVHRCPYRRCLSQVKTQFMLHCSIMPMPNGNVLYRSHQ